MILNAPLDRPSRLKALKALMEAEQFIAALKAIPRSQRELEGRTARLTRAILEELFERAKISVEAGTWSYIKAAQMNVALETYRQELMRYSSEQARKAARYGQNRIIGQVQSLPGMGKGLVHKELGVPQRRQANGIAVKTTDRFIASLGREILKVPRTADPSEWDKLVDRSTKAFARDLTSEARSSAEYDAARRYANEIEWDDSDDRFVRPSHQLVDGERVKPGDAFSNGCRYPKDPEGPLDEVVACRCRIRVVS